MFFTPAEFNRLHNQQFKECNQIYAEIARHCGLSETAFWLLYMLRENGAPMTQADLCAELCLSKQTVNSALKSLERTGHIRLETAPNDRRSKRVSLTDAGCAAAAQTVDPILTMEEAVAARLSDEERTVILDLGHRCLALLREEAQRFMQDGGVR